MNMQYNENNEHQLNFHSNDMDIDDEFDFERKKAPSKIVKNEIRFMHKKCPKCQLLNSLAEKILSKCPYFNTEECTANKNRLVFGPDPSFLISGFSDKIATIILNKEDSKLISLFGKIMNKESNVQHLRDILLTTAEYLIERTNESFDEEVKV